LKGFSKDPVVMGFLFLIFWDCVSINRYLQSTSGASFFIHLFQAA